MKDEANGIKYEPETHFAYYITKPEGTVIGITDERQSFLEPGSTYSQAVAEKVYGIISKSAVYK